MDKKLTVITAPGAHYASAKKAKAQTTLLHYYAFAEKANNQTEDIEEIKIKSSIIPSLKKRSPNEALFEVNSNDSSSDDEDEYASASAKKAKTRTTLNEGTKILELVLQKKLLWYLSPEDIVRNLEQAASQDNFLSEAIYIAKATMYEEKAKLREGLKNSAKELGLQFYVIFPIDTNRDPICKAYINASSTLSCVEVVKLLKEKFKRKKELWDRKCYYYHDSWLDSPISQAYINGSSTLSCDDVVKFEKERGIRRKELSDRGVNRGNRYENSSLICEAYVNGFTTLLSCDEVVLFYTAEEKIKKIEETKRRKQLDARLMEFNQGIPGWSLDGYLTRDHTPCFLDRYLHGRSPVCCDQVAATIMLLTWSYKNDFFDFVIKLEYEMHNLVLHEGLSWKLALEQIMANPANANPDGYEIRYGSEFEWEDDNPITWDSYRGYYCECCPDEFILHPNSGYGFDSSFTDSDHAWMYENDSQD